MYRPYNMHTQYCTQVYFVYIVCTYASITYLFTYSSTYLIRCP